MPGIALSIFKFLHYQGLLLWRTKTFWVRALLCWMVGATIVLSDEAMNYDTRLQVRGPRTSRSGVIIIDVSEKDWAGFNLDNRNLLKPLKEVMTFTDAFFWSSVAWKKLLTQVLSAEPAAVGVNFFFGENIRVPNLGLGTREIFEDPRVVWGADVDSAGRVLLPSFANSLNANVGIRNVHADDDGNVRRFVSSPVYFPHLGVRVVQIAEPARAAVLNRIYQVSSLINYTGTGATYQVVSFGDVLAGRVPRETFKNRIVLVGSMSSSSEQVQTPLGRMSRVEVTANIVDNVLLKRSVNRLPNGFYLCLLALLMAVSIWALVTYPQSVALVFFVLSGILWAAASVWAFDAIYFWVPVLAPIGQLTTTYIVFLSFQLSLNEQRTWRLEQEQKFISETEQLKTNFVSMMSHDLKTPIAKIQAICDRLLAATLDAPLEQDLKSLRRSSDDLHRYIQSILKVTKIEAKDFKISKEVTDINEDIERVVVRLAPLASEREISLRTQLEPLFSIEADTNLIQEVIHNLIENALKYTPAGGQVVVKSEEKDDNVIVVVEDTGPGIAPEEQKEIWGKFTRGRQLPVETKGTGLGLYLVKYFVELHGGEVFLESTPGQGTKIGFSIPAV
jgi:two-component system phosphate regulon sensor histidine kinase PhoR